MMKRMISYQSEHDLFCFIVNYHALTSQRDGQKLRHQTLEAAMDFIALGLDPALCTFWIQSEVPEVTELAWILSNITGMGLLERCHSYKDKIANGITPNHGLFAYPVLMAADILIMQAELIPVGQDQKQHLEVTVDIAEKFNHIYGESFIIPQPEIQEGLALLPGIDGRKMAKSYNNTIDIFCDKNTLKKRVMSIKTDSTPIEEPKCLEDNTLFDLYTLFLDNKGKEDLTQRFLSPGLRYGDVKKELLELIWDYFEPYRNKRESLNASREEVEQALKRGAAKAREIASATMRDIRKKVGLN